jgi:anaerobic magnesium-protoporphyrin IX monomethyl ester cyclase
MRDSISVASVLAALEEKRSSVLQEFAWCCALLLSEVEPEARSELLDRLLNAALEADPDLQSWVLGELSHHLEEMAPAVQNRFMAAYAAAPKPDSCGCSANESDLRSRLDRRIRASAGTNKTERTLTSQPVRDDRNLPMVALIIPEFLSANSFLQPPLEMLLAAARLRNTGYRVKLIDNRVESLSLELLASKLRDANIIAVTTTPYDHIQNYFLDYRLRHSFRTISFLKQQCLDAVLIACGAHGTVRSDIVFNESLADIVLKGEFDTGLLPLVNAIYANSDLAQLIDVVVRNQPASPVDDHGGVRPYQLVQLGQHFKSNKTLDDWVMPAYDLIDLDSYYGDVYVNNRLQPLRRCATTLATRGCAHDCSFCFNFWGRRVRYRSPESVVEEMLYLEHELRVSHVFFLDFHFSQDQSWVSKLCNLLRTEGSQLGWSAQLRCDAAPLALLQDMASANCGHLWFGVESFDRDIISATHKYPGPQTSIDAIANCRTAGIQPHLFVMIGLPGETRKSINTTIVEMHAAKASYCGVMVATPRFGTSYYELAKEQFPQLGKDFYGLRSVRGLIANELKPSDLQEALSVFEQRDFIYRPAPQTLDIARSLQ